MTPLGGQIKSRNPTGNASQPVGLLLRRHSGTTNLATANTVFGVAATNAKFWADKVRQNKARDRDTDERLADAGWLTLRIWEHELARKNAARLVRRIRQALGWR